jgi:hypothetical protein
MCPSKQAGRKPLYRRLRIASCEMCKTTNAGTQTFSVTVSAGEDGKYGGMRLVET